MTMDYDMNRRFWPVNVRYLHQGVFTIDLVNRWASVNNKTIQLPSCAFECLVSLVRNSPKPVSFKDLAQASPGLPVSQIGIQDKARMHIYILKKALDQNQESSGRIKSVPGYGYWLKTY